MTSKKGIAVTIGILAAITAASFLIWLIPLNNENTFVVSDFESNLEDVKEIHLTLQKGIEQEFQNLLDEKILKKMKISELRTECLKCGLNIEGKTKPLLQQALP